MTSSMTEGPVKTTLQPAPYWQAAEVLKPKKVARTVTGDTGSHISLNQFRIPNKRYRNIFSKLVWSLSVQTAYKPVDVTIERQCSGRQCSGRKQGK